MALRDWLGRTETRVDTITAAPIRALAATLDRDDPVPRPGDRLPLLWHWLYFLPLAQQSELGDDGHERLGGFLPPVPLPRRMYAGGRIEIRHPLRVGEAVQRTSRIVEIDEKTGRSGPLVFVKIRHEISGPAGLSLIEDHDVVYRSSAKDAEDRARPSTGRGRADPEVAEWEREIRPDEALLFRFSALTFNGHRIHYDRRYATEVQGYPGLVVHAPLMATLLADLIRRHLPDASVSTFWFRAHRPMFDGVTCALGGCQDADGGTVKLWARGADGAVAMDAVATLSASSSTGVIGQH